MRRWMGISLILISAPLLLVACGGSETTVRQTVEAAAKAAELGLNTRNLETVEPFFATEAEGANQDGLKETRDALRAFTASLTGRDQVQFHSFKVQTVAVHESEGLARATYQLQVSVARGSQVIFSAVVVQDLALLQPPRGWRISGGDQPQVSDVRGQMATPPPPATAAATTAQGGGSVAVVPSVAFVLKTGIAEGRLAFLGVGGAIDGQVNPALPVKLGDTVQISLINGEGTEHDLTIPDFAVHSDRVLAKGAASAVVFKVDKSSAFPYFCSVPGHRQAGMEGKIVVGAAAPPAVTAPSISRDPAEVPPPGGDRPEQTVRVDLETVEVAGRLADGATYTYWTFNGKVPGPFLRVRLGDTVELHLKNNAQNHMTHSIDLHAVTGPGGGATVMQVPPGQEKLFTFKTLQAGLYLYHCATPMVAQHIASGMYGLVLVEPKGGLPQVDHEYYVMQGELYTHGPFGQQGKQEFDVTKLLAEQPEYFVLNGAVGALTAEHPLHAKVGETVRIFYGVGGPNATASFHIIGEIFDRVYDQASLTSPPLTDVQTTTIPAGGAAMVEFKVEVPGRYILVDHALARLERGLAGYLVVEGPANDAIYHGTTEASGSSGH